MLNRSDKGREAHARLLITGFGPFPGVEENPSGVVVERIARDGWAPPGARLDAEVVPVHWAEAPDTIARRVAASRCEGLLMVGVAAKARNFRVEMRAQNRVDRRRRDAQGRAWLGDKILPTGPAVARSTAPVAEIVRAIQDAGLPAEASSDAGDYLCNFTLYRMLVGAAGDPRGPMAGFLHVPVAIVRDGREFQLSISDIERAVKAAATAFALRLRPVEPVLASA